jgi:hypothetical protein
MKLDRNTNPDGHGKYALILLRSKDTAHINPQHQTGTFVVPVEAVDFGSTPDTEFFVIRIKDKNAANALMAYSVSCRVDDPEFAREVLELANRAAAYQPKQRPT